jgi:hypothetical protein
MSPGGAIPAPLRGWGIGCGALVRGLAPPGYLPASLPGLEELSHRFRATADAEGEKLEGCSQDTISFRNWLI